MIDVIIAAVLGFFFGSTFGMFLTTLLIAAKDNEECPRKDGEANEPMEEQ